jgi:CubicO group peptidase (beta-lactamase class C family)
MRSAACLHAFAILLLLLTSFGQPMARGPAKARGAWPGGTWKVAKSPDKAGWSSGRLAAAKAYGDTIHTSAVMIVQGGEVIEHWGDFNKKITSYSVRKSLISALYGIYSTEGVIDINQTLEQLKIDDSPDPLTKQEKSARIVDILRARSGVYHPVAFESPNQKKFRPARDSHVPGTFWYYNNWDFNVLGTIFEKKTGKKIGQAFYERIAKPIGMQDFKPGDVFYLGGPESMHPAFLFDMTARDLARFGLLYLRSGHWKGKQIIPEAWVEKSSHANEMVNFNGADTGGYEYLWWVEYGGKHFPEATLPGMYSARGAGGHYLLVIPSLDMVIVHRVDNEATVKDVKNVTEQGLRPLVTNATFGHLVKLILDARTQ